jgi:hypothetical protein
VAGDRRAEHQEVLDPLPRPGGRQQGAPEPASPLRRFGLRPARREGDVVGSLTAGREAAVAVADNVASFGLHPTNSTGPGSGRCQPSAPESVRATAVS